MLTQVGQGQRLPEWCGRQCCRLTMCLSSLTQALHTMDFRSWNLVSRDLCKQTGVRTSGCSADNHVVRTDSKSTRSKAVTSEEFSENRCPLGLLDRDASIFSVG